jgi:hypothetical protein
VNSIPVESVRSRSAKSRPVNAPSKTFPVFIVTTTEVPRRRVSILCHVPKLDLERSVRGDCVNPDQYRPTDAQADEKITAAIRNVRKLFVESV